MKVKRSGFVYSLYRKNILHLWILTALLLAAVGFLLIHHQGASYLMNYLFYRSEPNVEALTAYTERDMLDRDTVLSDIQKNGGEDALLRQRPSCGSGPAASFVQISIRKGAAIAFQFPSSEKN